MRRLRVLHGPISYHCHREGRAIASEDHCARVEAVRTSIAEGQENLKTVWSAAPRWKLLTL